MTDHDRLFKELINTFFVEFLELFLPQVITYFEPTSLIALDKEIFTDVTSGTRYETDVLMQSQFMGKDSYFLIHLEHQSYSQADFDERMFRYFACLYEKFNRPVYPIVLFSYDKPKKAAKRVHRMKFPDLDVLNFKYRVVQLNRLDWQDFVNRPNPVASALMAKMKIAPEDRVKVKLECLKMLVGLNLDEARVQLISGFVDTYLDLNEAEEQNFQTELEKFRPAEKEGSMKIVTSWMRDGMRQRELELVLRSLNRKVGELGPVLEAQVQGLSSSQIDELMIALFDFSQQQDLVSWLEKQPVAEGSSTK